MNRTDKVSLNEAREALLRSGYLIESHVETMLIRNGFYVESNQAYLDPTTGKSRELDLYALQGWKLSNDYDFFFPVLLIECVNNPQPIAFITKEPIVDFLNIEALNLAGIPAKVYSQKERSWISLLDFVDMAKYHHYCKGRIATQFCSFKKKDSDEWMALHEDSQFDALKKLCDVTEYFVAKQYSDWDFSDTANLINLEFYHPVLVLQGDLLEVRTSKRGPKLIRAHHIQYRRACIVRNESVDYQIDVVTAAYFQKYLDMLHLEWKKTESRLKRRRPLLHKSVRKLLQQVKRLRSAQKVRAVLEPV